MTKNTAQKIINAGFDISLIAEGAPSIEKSHTVTVIFDEEGNHQAGFEIVEGGKNSLQYRHAIRASDTGIVMTSQQKNKQIDAKTFDGATAILDRGDDRNFKIACAVIVGLPGFVDKGAPVPVTDEFLRAVFTKFPVWQEKILAALEVDADFLAI